MTTGSEAGETDPRGVGRAVPDAENYLDLSGIEDEDPGPHFDVVLRGYDRRQVDEHVSGLRRMVAQLRAQLAVRERRSTSEPEAGATPAPATTVPTARDGGVGGADEHDDPGDGTVEAFNDRLRGILQAAEQEAHAVRSKAAETLLAEHAESRAALADLRSQRDAVVDELVRLRGWLDEIVSHPGRTPAAPPPVLTPGPSRGRPWPPHGPPPPVRPAAGPPPTGRYGAAPWPPGAPGTPDGTAGHAGPSDADGPDGADGADGAAGAAGVEGPSTAPDDAEGAETDTMPRER